MIEQPPIRQNPDLHERPYAANYYLDTDGYPHNTFAFDDVLTMSRAQAIASAAGVPDGGRVLDYGCGLGALTAAFSRLGYDAVGVDSSPHAIEHALPEARDLVLPLNQQVLSGFEAKTFDLVVAKDVFEHIPQHQLHDVADHLLWLGNQIMAIIPLVGEDRKFIFPLYEDDPTHVTRLTRDEWLGFFPYTFVEDRQDLTPKVRRADKVASTLCMQLAEPDPARQRFIESVVTPHRIQQGGGVRHLIRRLRQDRHHAQERHFGRNTVSRPPSRAFPLTHNQRDLSK